MFLQISQNSPLPVPVLFSCDFLIFSSFSHTFVRLLLKFVGYLFLKRFFVFLDKSILLQRRCLTSKFSGILGTFFRLFSPYVGVSLFSPDLVFSDRKNFCSILTDFSNLLPSNRLSKGPFARLWFEKCYIKHFPKM